MYANALCLGILSLYWFKKAYDKIPADYRFVKSQPVALFFGGWCLFVTAACCIMGVTQLTYLQWL